MIMMAMRISINRPHATPPDSKAVLYSKVIRINRYRSITLINLMNVHLCIKLTYLILCTGKWQCWRFSC